jgi:hypothetical protein
LSIGGDDDNPTPSAVDEAMDEIEHLLQAGGKSQALGRLRNA